MEPSRLRSTGGAGTEVRRVIVLAILYALVVIAAIGLSGLLERAVNAGRTITYDESTLALSLAFALIGAPLAGVLWWWQYRKLSDPSERASELWALYVMAMSLTSLVVATVELSLAAGALIEGEWEPGHLAAGIVWSGVWLWHLQIRRSARTAPTQFRSVSAGLGAVYGLAVGASGLISALAVLISQALTDGSLVIVSSPHWSVLLLQALVWASLGALVWWWHWFGEGARHASGTFADVLVVVVVGAAAATALFAIGTVLFVVLRILFDSDPLAEIVSAADTAFAAALIGALVWVYHAHIVAGRSEPVQRAGRLAVSAVALAGAASGFGVIVNALLAPFGDVLVDNDPRTLLLGGISALAVGAPVWWIAWRPARPVTAEEAAEPPRRVYLIAVFGASAVVAIITVLIVGYRLFEFGLGSGGAGGLIERVRAPFGLLSATVVVFAYHFAVWRHDRAESAEIASTPSIRRLILVTNSEAPGLARVLRTETGAAVTVWRTVDEDAHLDENDLPVLREALRDLTASRVLVISDADRRIRIIPLAD